MEERSRLTAAAAELGDTGRCRVDIAGALVSPLISAPRLELVLRGLPIVIYMILSVAGFQSSLGLFVLTAKFACAFEFIRRGLAWEVRGHSAFSDRFSESRFHSLDHIQIASCPRMSF